MPPIVSIGSNSGAVAPIKLDGKVYFVLAGTYTRTYHEQTVTEKYTGSGGFDRQVFQTGKIRWGMTLLVPISTNQLTISNRRSADDIDVADCGTLADLRASHVKVYPNDFLELYDIESNWDFTGTNTHDVYLSCQSEQPQNNNIALWQVPISLWGDSA